MRPQTIHVGKQHILYDAERIEEASPNLFDPEWYEQAGALRGSAQGRGTTHFVTVRKQMAVLRHYRRGGVVANISDDHYLNFGLQRSRPWREWRLLARLHELQLPAPIPLAARVVRSGWRYQGDLLTLKIPDARPLSMWLSERSIGESVWQSIGVCIRNFHRAGVYHADLNAHNILLNTSQQVFLIDFDKGAIRKSADGWQQANLSRLHRSLTKLSGLSTTLCFDDRAWEQLKSGYEGVA